MSKINVGIVLFSLTVLLMSCNTCNRDTSNVNSRDEYDIESYFVIDYNVKLYADEKSDRVVKNLDFF